MTDNDFHARRTELSNTFAAAGAELLDYMRCAGALAAIPNTQQYVVAGNIAAIRAQLDTVEPQRRMRHGDRPELPLYFGAEAGQPRRWAALITSAGHGVLQEYGSAFEHAQPGQEVLEVMEILPGAAIKRPLDENDFHGIWEKLGGSNAVMKTFGYHQFGFAVQDAVLRKSAPLATPPATTGASTVLTDERIDQIAETYDTLGPRRVGANMHIVIREFAKEVAQEAVAAQAGQVAATELQVRRATDELSLPELAEQFAAVEALGCDYTLSAKVCGKLFRAMTTPPDDAAGQVAVPEGWKLVPLAPTLEMQQAGFNVHGAHMYSASYRAMVAAAPSPAKESK